MRIKPYREGSSHRIGRTQRRNKAERRAHLVTKLVELLGHHLCLLSLTQSKVRVYDVDKDPEMIRPLGKLASLTRTPTRTPAKSLRVTEL